MTDRCPYCSFSPTTLSDYCEAHRAAPAEPECSTHPDAQHGFDRNGSHTNDRYTCDCEGWVQALVAKWEFSPPDDVSPNTKLSGAEGVQSTNSLD